MSTNNTKPIPRDKGGEALQNFPPVALAQQRYISENGTTSSVISVSDNTVSIEVAAVGTAAALKWIPLANTNPSVITGVGTANYDHIISKDTVRQFAIPYETTGASQGSVVGINRQAGLYQRVAIKSMGIGSVLTSEF